MRRIIQLRSEIPLGYCNYEYRVLGLYAQVLSLLSQIVVQLGEMYVKPSFCVDCYVSTFDDNQSRCSKYYHK